MIEPGYWEVLNLWFIEEAAQLCFDIEPIDHDYDEYDYVPDGLPEALPVEVKRLYSRIERAIKAGALRASYESDKYGSLRYAVKPKTFVSWCNSERVSFPIELKEAIQAVSASKSQNHGHAEMATFQDEHKSLGRPLKYDWDLFHAEIVRIANTPDGLPGKQSDLVKLMLSWFLERGDEEPAESAVKQRISKIYKYLEGQKESQK